MVRLELTARRPPVGPFEMFAKRSGATGAACETSRRSGPDFPGSFQAGSPKSESQTYADHCDRQT